MQYSGPEFVGFINISICVFNKELNQAKVAMVSGKVKCCESFVGWVIGPVLKYSLLLIR
jgi:hypothetical protein